MKTLLSTLAMGLVSLAIATPASAQVQPAQGAGAKAPQYRIAVLDISYVFKQHGRFNADIERMKQRMKAIETEVKADQQVIIDKRNSMQEQFKVGTPGYKTADQEITQMAANLQVKMAGRRKDFLEEEARTYYSTYLEVTDAVKYYAQRNNIGLVLRFDGEKCNGAVREDILRSINKPVIFQDSIDITPDIIALLNRDGNAAPAGPPRGANLIPGGAPR